MTSMNKEAIVLKSDGAGRVQTPVERQAELVREFERSGLSGPRFAALAGVKYQTFATWRRRHGVSGGSREQRKPVVKPVFLEVTAACPAAVAAGPVCRAAHGPACMTRASAARCCSRLLRPAAAGALIRKPTCVTSSPACHL